MKIILIVGERGTGKTTISKNVSGELGYNYYTDFDILRGLEINHNSIDGDNGGKILINLYSKFFKEHENENIVVDAETTILPSQVKILQEEFDIDAIFLGFDGIDEEALCKQLQTRKTNMTLDEVKNQAWGLLGLGKKIKLMCKEDNIRFQSINKNRNLVIENLSKELINKYKILA